MINGIQNKIFQLDPAPTPPSLQQPLCFTLCVPQLGKRSIRHPGEKSVGHGAATFTRGFLDACRIRRSASHVDPRGPCSVYPAKQAHKGGLGRHVRFSRRSHFKGPSGVVVAAAAADRLRVTWLRLLTITPSYYRPQPRDRQVYDRRNY